MTRLSSRPVPGGRRIVFLDVDGTLIDSFRGIRAGFLHALDTIGVDHPSEEFVDNIAGPPMENTLTSLGLSPEQVGRAFSAYMDYTRRGGWAQSAAFPGIHELLSSLHPDFYLATATSKGEEFAYASLKKLGLLPYIDFLGAAQEKGTRREKAQVIDYVLENLEIVDRSADILMVGDRSHDIDGATAHGIDTVAVAWGYGRPDEWKAARYTADSPEELEEIIRDWSSY